MLRFNDIADRMLEYNPAVDLELLQRAYVYSAKVHDGQERLSGEPYLVHPLEVAGILVQLRVDDVSVAAGLLHDALEDTLTTREDIEAHFGEQVAFLVEGLTKIAKLEFRSARERQAENFRKMLIAMSKDIRILLIKLADRLHNMRTLSYLTDDARRRIAEETLEIYVPLAHRLGIYWMKQELESLAFRTLNPDLAAELEAELSGMREERDAYIGKVIGILSAKLEACGLDIELSGRRKELASIHHKMVSQGISLDQIYDVIAFRVIVNGDEADCYAALGIVHSIWPPVPSRFKDYIALAKRNGYQSLHTTVIGAYGERMEVQIRTQAMHRDAELGIAAHWKYKEGRIEAADDDSKFAWLRQLLEFQGELADPHEFLETVKIDLFPDEVFVFTPRGDVINLPARATPIDFAYAIHSEVGDHCAGAKVNGKLVSLRHELQDGDTVEIRTAREQFPRKDWLEFVVSSKAKSWVRHSLRQSERERSRELGREILEKELRRAGMSLAKLQQRGELAKLAAKERRNWKVEDLFSALGYGKLSAQALVKKIRGDAPEATVSETPSAINQAERALRNLIARARGGRSPSRAGAGIRVGGERDVLVRFGGCCDPLPGDEVIGFVTRGRGVTVHSKGCGRIYELDPERRIAVDWDDDGSIHRKIRIRVATRDEPGILANITSVISAAGINIGDTRSRTRAGESSVQSYELWVPNLAALNAVMKTIARVKGVTSVERVRG